MMKKVLIALSALIAIILIVPAFLRSHFFMSRSIEINAPVAIVFNKLTDLHEYAKWNPFPEGDASNQNEISGVGLGSFMSWKGEKTGEGKMTLTQIDPPKKIAVKMDFYKPMAAEGMVYWITQPKSESATELTWTFEQDLSYFLRYFGLMMDSMMGKHFERGLQNYKTLVESGR